ncbi:single-stranded-DNA-specific exonuclease [Thermosulfidibacter takaii ABI70S6]|uniref:Single-stranded-DNA-specific exonuclease RecJ n=1 Tax=Thermosulfidibacter takaii (strain DSM 17441 / JCM 13301 / NBRC 103674 / ABI70S6) TaxID=1298851 RepID=A0A0S3QTM8_THET7|nr:single-stranded-DNA-specific exonuclease RecJ [Thermosulfidibacter takaii]BAT71649.1 single-stranded-DNA-specific exonuclease [Thermosulfidibacter takaii ABI70S6]
MKWKILNPDPQVVSRLIQEADITELTAKILANRGIKNTEQALGYISDPLRLLHDPYLFKNMEKATERIVRVIKNKEKILIFGDYDADGVTATAILYLFLKKMGASVEIFIPDRFTQGYGLTQRSLKKLEAQEFSVLVTVDCGITSIEETAWLTSQGIDVIITDHHTPGALLPTMAYAIINPQCDPEYPFKGLAGVGVALKLAEGVALALEGDNLRKEVLKEYIPLAAVGTVADVMQIVDENRFFVKYGLRKLTDNLGLRWLSRIAGIQEDKNFSLFDISFIIAPRINAPGRMSHAAKALKLLTTENEAEAEKIARELNKENSHRQKEEEKVLEEALSIYEDDGSNIAIVYQNGWHPGVIGIAASKMARRVKKPTVLISFNGSEMGRGSGRSYANVDLYNLMAAASNITKHFGGHRNAVGFSVEKDKVEQLIEKVKEKSLSVELEEESLEIDDTITFEHLEVSFLRELLHLSPFGEGFPEPQFIFKDVLIRKLREAGRKTLLFEAKQKNVVIDAISFEPIEEMKQEGIYDLVATVEISEWRGKKRLRLRCKDAKRKR